MMQSEFFERTGVNLTGEEYADVEHIYNSVQMNKDEFCQLWLKNRDNKIIAELMDIIKKLEDDCQELKKINETQENEYESFKAQMEGELQQMSDTHKQHMEDFAGKLIQACEYEDMPTAMYQEIEEEFGLPFIIRNKWNHSIELQDAEIQYMVDKLQ
jgi:hypothetical protein